MKEMKDLLNSQSFLLSSESKPELTENIKRLWLLMTAIFGPQWISSYGEKVDPQRVWMASLNGLTEKQVANGLEKLVKSGSKWPPNASEFRAMCDHDKPPCLAHRPFKSVKCLPRTQEAKDRDFRLAKFKLDKMRAQIRGEV